MESALWSLSCPSEKWLLGGIVPALDFLRAYIVSDVVDWGAGLLVVRGARSKLVPLVGGRGDEGDALVSRSGLHQLLPIPGAATCSKVRCQS